jgi:signal transduction histidine kinase
LTNSIKFTNKGSITIVVKTTYNKAVFKISDSGPAIYKDILPRLFDKFITGSPSGTGLGLYICKNIIETHGGNIWAKNDDQNKGATFTFTLPFDTQKLVQL